MKVYIIGAGPGAPDLITVRGARLIETCPVVLYTGSLVPPELIARAAPTAEVLDSKGMTLDEIMAVLERAQAQGLDVARVHTGDPSIFGSTAEQMRRMRSVGIEYEVVPGVSSFVAAAAALGQELTLPEIAQTVIVSRVEGRTPMPEGEKLDDLARHKTTLALFLSITLVKKWVDELVPHYGRDCPVAVVYKASMPDEKIVRGTLADVASQISDAGIRSQAMILVGPALDCEDFPDSRLYAAEFQHRFRKRSQAPAPDSQGGSSS